MEDRNLVYALYGPDGKPHYVGYTTNTVRYRVNNHRSTAKAGHPAPVNEWIREVGLDNYEGRVLEVVPVGTSLAERAQVWIEGFTKAGHTLVNCTPEQHVKRTKAALDRPEVREKIKNQPRNYVRTPEWRAAISQANKGRVISEEHRAIISKTHTGKVVSEETRKKIAEKAKGHKRNLGKHHSEEAKAKMSLTKHQNQHVAKGVSKATCKHCITT